MRAINKYVFKAYLGIVNSIAFYPSIIAVAFFLFSMVVVAWEYEQSVITLKKEFSSLLVDGSENARLILGTLLGSTISLMAFSFSMVMVVLNQASSTLSPRVIPGLITKKAHQVVLGVYLGTIIYALILIINIQASEDENRVPSMGVFFAMVFGITSLGMFVFFIHSISRTIQADNILNRIFFRTLREMDNVKVAEDQPELPRTSKWTVINCNTSGYLKQVNVTDMVQLCIKHNLIIEVLQQKGFFLVEGYPYLKVNKPVEDALVESLHNCVVFYPEEHVNDHYLFGMKHISEIAVKALSPGINDIGTAVKAVDMLTLLFIKKMKLNEKNYVTDKQHNIRIIFKSITLETLLYDNLIPIREYGKEDAFVMYNILEGLKNLVYADKDAKRHQNLLLKYCVSMVNSCRRHISNDLDVEKINSMISKINRWLEPKLDELNQKE